MSTHAGNGITKGSMRSRKAVKVDRYHAVQDMFTHMISELDLQGHLEAFGSYRSGFRTGTSDIDLVYVPTEEERRLEQSGVLTPLMILQRFHVAMQRAGFTNIVSVFQASMPLLKAVSSTGADIDLCVGNDLGLRNSRLMKLYADIDHRVAAIGQCVKHWAKYHDLTCSSDGHLNSYGYTLLTIFYLMHTDPPIVPNLQLISKRVDNAPDLVQDHRWGCDDVWDCQFFQEIYLVHRTKNKLSIGELLRGFFRFYVDQFDWHTSAVSIRLARTQKKEIAVSKLGKGEFKYPHPSKDGLLSTQGSQAWYIEDPFDLKHNLAALSSNIARQRILDEMRRMLDAMDKEGDPMGGFWSVCHGETANVVCYLKCRVNLDKASRDDFVNHFSSCPVLKFFWPQQAALVGRTEAFLMFANERDRRRTHTLNEQYTEGGWQLRLLVCSTHAMEDARTECGVVFDKVDGPGSDVQMMEESATDQATQIQHGLRLAESRDEVNVLVQRARALGLHHEASRVRTNSSGAF